MKSLNSVFLALGLVLGFTISIASMPASANGGYAHVGASYHMNSGGTFSPGAGTVVVYPSGRVVVQHPQVTHVYPNGENLVYQNGGQRVYTKGYGGAATCYVDCWHGGVRPNSGGSHFSFSVGAHKTW